MMQIGYIGKAEYCYANSAAMLLASIGESVRPETIEVGCGIGLGAFIEEATGNLFFSPFVVAPDEGLTRALGILGFQADNGSFEPGSALAGLRELLKAGRPVVIGPADMGYMAYNPRRAAGADHFVLVYGMDGDEFLIHDPYGYPHVRLAADELLKAWQAEAIGYKRSAFQYWHAPKRVARPGEEQICAGIWDFFRELYAKIAELKHQGGPLLGAEAISRFADALASGSLAEPAEKFLTGFQLPLAAKRANDYAAFFAGIRPGFAEYKAELAECFGRAHSYLAVGNTTAAATDLKQIASLETKVARLFN